MKFRAFQKFTAPRFATYFTVLVCAVVFGFSQPKTPASKRAAIENALYTRTEFFGAQAIVPYPTEQARARLGEVLGKFPDDAEILLKLAELDEKLGRFSEAEAAILAVKPANLQVLADYYGRRGAFAEQAEILEKILLNAPADTRDAAFSNLILFAKKHNLKKYLTPEFYQKIIDQTDGTVSVLFDYVKKLTEEKNYAEALIILDENAPKFPQLKSLFLEKKITILTEQNKFAEAEEVYREAFDPFWTQEESESFYDFLNTNDRYRAYESELKQHFKRSPTNFAAAIRLIHLKKYQGDEFGDIVRMLEDSRSAKKIGWSEDELLTVSQYLIEAGDGDAASRFLYTLCADPRVREKGELRRRVLYQIFVLLSDAGYERLALTRGSLDFYETVAKSDARPGITTGILSLIFSDANPRAEFESKEATAVKLFNRAAAYRVFQEFKTAYRDAPELAQMYLDLVRLYTTSKNLDVANQILEEFEVKTENFKDYADAAMKLADAYVAVKRFDKEREIYQKLLDFLGKSDKRKFDGDFFIESKDLTQIRPQISTLPPVSNEGIRLSEPKKSEEYYYSEQKSYTNFLSSKSHEILYSDVLTRMVASLARENKTQEILDLYAAETAKYPTEEALYEQMLQWLGQTNLAEKQFEVYQNALRNFPSKSWHDRFARWLIRNKRGGEFENFSRSFIETFDDAATQEYLKQFIDGKEISGAKSLDGQMFFALYSLAHERFPRNIVFVIGLLRYYKQNKMEPEWRNLLAEYYFESPEIRTEFLTNLAKTGELRAFLQNSEAPSATSGIESLPYKLFRADASAWLSDFEKSVVFYRELNQLYPNESELSEKFLTIARSFGQTNRNLLLESATFAQNQADNFPAEENYRVRAGELQAEFGDYAKARQNWEKLITLAAGENESYLTTATVFWDYFQFDDALATIKSLREKSQNENLYAFQCGAILEAQNDKSAAIREYIKALDENEIAADRWRAKERLKQFYLKPELAKEIHAVYENARPRAKNDFRLTFNFADALFQMKHKQEAVNLILRQIKNEKSEENLIEARQFFSDLDEEKAVQIALQRLIKTSQNQRDAISYRLRLADSFRESFEAEKSKNMLAELVAKFPNNYGVLKEAETFYWDLGEREKSVAVLQSARTRARGEYFYRFSRRLAERLNSLNRTAEAEKILLELQNANPNDADVFGALTGIYVRTDRADALRKAFAMTIEALKKQPLEPREFKWQAAELRKKMISAFTRLKDYDSAAGQYIEIINREPENEEFLEEAIAYAKRYGGAARLAEYYEKVAAESFKNYRWNVVLARIYEADGDFGRAAENYKTAIFNQPEMTELYESLGEIYVKTQNYESALKNIGKLLELTGEDIKYIKQKAQILEKLGKRTEADAMRARLPAEELPKAPTLNEQFAEAQNLRRTENEKAIEKYRAAFEDLAQNPFQTTLKQTEITGYVQTVYAEDSLDKITEKLWNLRQKMSSEISKTDSFNSGKAIQNRQTLDSAFAESVSQIIKTKATGNEISDLRTDIEARLDSTEKSDLSSFSLLHNLISRCGFNDLEEKILLKTLENAAAENREHSLRAVVGFYQKRSNFHRVLEVLKNDLANQKLDLIKVYAENARILDETDKELAALEIIFGKQATGDEFTKRYFEILYEKNRAALENLARQPSAHHLQLINFLLSKREFDLAKEAIKTAPFSEIWKSARTAETSLEFGKFTAENQFEFINALKLAPIGELVKQRANTQNQLVGSDWFNLSEKYGRWLFSAEQKANAEIFLNARIEKSPKDADAQADLGYFYLERRDFARALEHFNLASDLRPYDESILPYIGAAYFQTGERQKAFELWGKIIAGEETTIENAALYLKTLTDFGQAEKARVDLKPFLLQKLTSENHETSKLDDLIRNLSETFSDEATKTVYFLEICKSSDEDTLLPRFLIEESLIAEKDFGEFYKILIARAEGFDGYQHDYKFVSVLEQTWDAETAENLYDAENDFTIEDAKSERLGWQQKYLEYLFERRNYAAATRLVGEIESSLKGHYARPAWLRLARFRAGLAQNQTASVFAKMLKFTGIELAPDAQNAALPNLERFNRLIEILKSENLDELALNLSESFYARMLAVGQYDEANFAGLARTEFQRNSEASALEILKIMTEFHNPARQAELDSMPLVEKFKDPAKLPFEPRNSLQSNESLKLAAELSAEFGALAEAISFRQKLREFAPLDALNRLETARLAAHLKRTDEAVSMLLEIIQDKNFDRQARWQSLLILSEIVGSDVAFWQKIATENSFLQQDSEVWTAFGAMAKFHTEERREALNLLQENSLTLELKFLRAVYEKNSGFGEDALQSFSEIAERNNEIEEVFGFYAFAPQFEQIDSLLEISKPRAALALAAKIGVLKIYENTNHSAYRNFSYKTIAVRASERKSEEALRLLGKLSAAAELIGDFSQAIEYEKSRAKFLQNFEDLKAATTRIEELKRKSVEKTNRPLNYSINENLVSD